MSSPKEYGSVSALTGFYEMYKGGHLVKAKTRFGRRKELCITTFRDVVYLHISDHSKCFIGGKFDITKAKFISMRLDEMEELYDCNDNISYYGRQFANVIEQPTAAVNEPEENPPTMAEMEAGPARVAMPNIKRADQKGPAQRVVAIGGGRLKRKSTPEGQGDAKRVYK